MTTTLQKQERDTDSEDRRCLMCTARSGKRICKRCQDEMAEQARSLRA